MIFHRITVTNLFSYLGEQTYEFDPRSGKTVALVIGRNGYGKTSLLNAMKLLFLGTDDKAQRRVGFPPRGLSRSEYVLGVDRGWAGILNRHSTDRYCSVRAELGDGKQVVFTATRSWRFEGRSFEEDLRVQEGAAPEVAGSAAEERLNALLPRGLVPYFIFDGEELQYLAEAGDGARAEAMERLLSLSFITGVEAQLDEVVKEWRRQAMPNEVQAEIRAEEGRLALAQSETMTLRNQVDELRRALAEKNERKDTLRRRMDGVQAGGGIADTRRLEADIKATQDSLEAELAELAEELATDAPLLANPGLVKAALAPLAEAVEAKTQSANSVVVTLNEVLPQQLFSKPPLPTREPLSDNQRRFFEDKLRSILQSYDVTESAPTPLLDSLDLKRARELHQRFTRWSAAMATLRQGRARRLRDASAKRARLEQLKEEHREVQYGSGERAEEYRRLEAERDAVNAAMGKLEGDLERLAHKLEAKAAEEKDIVTKLNALERRHHQAGLAGERLGIAVALRETFEAYRAKTRAARRGEIEEAVNRHFRRLMSGHRMIERISIDDDFIMHFLDADGAEFGQLTVSHGMRQLAVTALLWALKDVSGRSLPIIVDTPLARIDRDNQHNLLNHYYPHAAEQVIILATDSEIDAEKYALLRPHVGVQFRLENPDGQSTHVVPVPVDHMAAE